MNANSNHLNIFISTKKNQVQQLLKYTENMTGADLDIIDNLGNTPVYYAVQNMHLEVLKTLIELGADVNKRCELGQTPLHQALMVGDRITKNESIVNCLISAKANPHLKNHFGQTPIYFAQKRFIDRNSLQEVPAMRIRHKDLYDPNKMKLDPRILEKLKEVNQKVANHQRVER